jgi:hypothetical protein
LKPVNESRVLLLLFVSLLLINCSGKKVPQDVLVKIYVENLIAEEKYSFNHDTLQLRQNKIFIENKITRKDFEETLKAMRDDPDAWDDFFKQSNILLDSLKKTKQID